MRATRASQAVMPSTIQAKIARSSVRTGGFGVTRASYSALRTPPNPPPDGFRAGLWYQDEARIAGRGPDGRCYPAPAVRTPVLLFLVALAVRLLLIALFPDPAYPDSYYYVDVARS